MKRSFITDLGIEDKAAVTAIINEHQRITKDIQRDLETAETALETAQKDLETAKQPDPKTAEKITELEGKLETANQALEDEKTAHATTKTDLDKAVADEKAAHEATKTGYATEKEAATTDESVFASLLAEKFHPDGVSLIKRFGYDRSIVKIKDGKITNNDKVIEHFKADSDFGKYFGEASQQRTENGSSEHSKQKTETFTKEAIEKMSTEEINKNWDKVQASLSTKT